MNSLNDYSSTTLLADQNSVFDLQSLRRETGVMTDKDSALQKAAEQFEGIFVRQLLTSMRKVNDIFKEDGLFESKSSDFYQGMWDDQIASSISSGNSSSISSLLVQQLGGSNHQSRYQTHTSSIATENNSSVISKNNPRESKIETNFEGVISKQVNDLIKDDSVSVKPSEPETFATKKDFVEYLLPLAKEAAERIGTSPSLLLAQAALETGWGKFFVETSDESSSKNLFNIKDKSDWTGDVAVKSSLEFDGDKFDLKKSGFRVYETFKESFDDYINFLNKSERYSGVIENASNPEKYLEQLQNSGYATDPQYAKKIHRIFNSDILKKIVD